MSLMSLLDDNLAVVHRRLLPVPLFELLTERGVELVDIAEEEYMTLGCNVLAVGSAAAGDGCRKSGDTETVGSGGLCRSPNSKAAKSVFPAPVARRA
jgi:hypothetical protein